MNKSMSSAPRVSEASGPPNVQSSRRPLSRSPPRAAGCGSAQPDHARIPYRFDVAAREPMSGLMHEHHDWQGQPQTSKQKQRRRRRANRSLEQTGERSMHPPSRTPIRRARPTRSPPMGGQAGRVLGLKSSASNNPASNSPTGVRPGNTGRLVTAAAHAQIRPAGLPAWSVATASALNTPRKSR